MSEYCVCSPKNRQHLCALLDALFGAVLYFGLMIEAKVISNDEFNYLLMLDDWMRERAATDAFHAEQALMNSSHKTFQEIENDY